MKLTCLLQHFLRSPHDMLLLAQIAGTKLAGWAWCRRRSSSLYTSRTFVPCSLTIAQHVPIHKLIRRSLRCPRIQIDSAIGHPYRRRATRSLEPALSVFHLAALELGIRGNFEAYPLTVSEFIQGKGKGDKPGIRILRG